MSDSARKICTACDCSCLTCSGATSEKCLTCDTNDPENGWLLIERSSCHETCPADSYVFSPSQKKCSICHSECKTCDGPNNNNCLSCDINNDSYDLLLESSKTCIASCPDRTYTFESTVCKACHVSCLTCDGSLVNKCLLCDTTNGLYGWYYSNSKICTNSCPPGTYASNSVEKFCTKCHSSCSLCSGPLATDCVLDTVEVSVPPFQRPPYNIIIKEGVNLNDQISN